MKCPLGNMQCECSMKEKLRKVFTDHVIYTKLYMEKYGTSRAETAVILKRLLSNQDDIANTLKPVIGIKQSKELARLLKQHIQLSGSMIAYVYQRDKKLADEAALKVFQNGRQVAEFLTELNPKTLPLRITEEMFDMHNKQVFKLAWCHGWKEYKEEAHVFDEYLVHMLRMSDAIAKAVE